MFIQVPSSFSGSWSPRYAKKHQSKFNLRKTRAEWPNMLQNMLPHPIPGERDSLFKDFFVDARPATKMKT